jgi:hypothetical protein
MGRVTLNSTLSAEFGASSMPVEVCDAGGKTLGFFVPSKAFYASVKPSISEEELLRRERAAGGRSWPEIRADLENEFGPAET